MQGIAGMKSTIIYLIRHGLPEIQLDAQGRQLMYGPDAVLSAEGRRQAAALAAQFINGEAPAALYASPYPRARETAEILARELGLPLTIDERLRDTLASGWVGVPMDEIRLLSNNELFSHPRTQETPARIDARMWAAFNDMVAREQRQIVGIVSHGDPLRILHWRIQHPQGDLPDMSELARRLTLGTAQACRVEYPFSCNTVQLGAHQPRPRGWHAREDAGAELI
jgi:probable phosphoglycerate mutase